MKRSLIAAACSAVVAGSVLAAPTPSYAATPIGELGVFFNEGVAGTCTYTTGSGAEPGFKQFLANKSKKVTGTRQSTYTGATPDDLVNLTQAGTYKSKVVVKNKSFVRLASTQSARVAIDPLLGKSATSCGLSASAESGMQVKLKVRGKGTLKFSVKANGARSAQTFVYAYSPAARKVYYSVANGGHTTTLKVPVPGTTTYQVAVYSNSDASTERALTSSISSTVTGSFTKGTGR
ncbi:hypothetical protein BH09ACT11_BH09ACT11_08270 [soil metagenome]